MSEHIPIDSFHALQQLDTLMSTEGAEHLELEVMKRGGVGQIALTYSDYIPKKTPADALITSVALMMHADMRIATDKGLNPPGHNAFKNGYVLANVAGALLLDPEIVQDIATQGLAVVYNGDANQIQGAASRERAKASVIRLAETGYYNFAKPYHDFIESERTLNEATATRDHDVFVKYGFGFFMSLADSVRAVLRLRDQSELEASVDSVDWDAVFRDSA